MPAAATKRSDSHLRRRRREAALVLAKRWPLHRFTKPNNIPRLCVILGDHAGGDGREDHIGFTQCYMMRPVSSANTRCISAEDVNTHGFNALFCKTINAFVHARCECDCGPLSQLDETFVLRTKYGDFVLPQPSIYTQRVSNYMKTFLRYMTEDNRAIAEAAHALKFYARGDGSATLRREISEMLRGAPLPLPDVQRVHAAIRVIDRLPEDAPLDAFQNYIVTTGKTKNNRALRQLARVLEGAYDVASRTKAHGRRYFDDMKNASFRYGSLGIVRGGKRSFVRKNMLANTCNGIRSIVIPAQRATPAHALYPMHIYKDHLPRSTNLVASLRYPAINITSRMVDEVVITPSHVHGALNVSVGVNEFSTAGPHVDFDGDCKNSEPINPDGPYMREAILECYAATWHGTRHTLDYSPKYNMSQTFGIMCAGYDAWFRENSALYKRVRDLFPRKTVKQAIDYIMTLGCSTERAAADEFIATGRHFAKHAPSQRLTVTDVFHNRGLLGATVKAGVKANSGHVAEFFSFLEDSRASGEYTSKVDYFNKLVTSSHAMGETGKDTFILLFGYQALTLHRDKVIVNDTWCLLKDVACSDAAAWMYYQEEAIEYTWACLMHPRE